MKSLKKKFFAIFFIIYFFIGSFNSINTGISFDERHEELNWNFHVNLVKEISDVIINGKKFDTNKFENNIQHFVGYGIGFQLISQPIQSVIKDLIAKQKNLDNYGAKLVAKHFVVFLFFFISGLFFYLILRKLIDNENFYILGSITYLTYPYLFGQSMFSPKDIPFMSVWLICTHLSFVLFENIIHNNKIKIKYTIIFSILTAYLLSIRIAGILIFIQYLIILICYLNLYKINLIQFLKKYYKDLILFSLVLIFFIFLFYPTFWINPLLFIEAIKVNTSHFNNVGTTTLGEIMYSQNLPVTYLIIWFSVKIPLLIMIGLFLLPITEKNIFKDKIKSILFGSILLSFLIISLILILRRVHLYDEIRQVLFLVPLIFIIGLTSLFIFSKKLFYLCGILTVVFFTAENIKINPYQYVWFNLPSRFLDLTKDFELEYQGISGREISKYIIKEKTKKNCILATPIWSVEPFMNNTQFDCFDIWQKIDTDYKRPFLAVQNVRNLKRSNPYKCTTIHETYSNLLFHKKKFVTGKLLRFE